MKQTNAIILAGGIGKRFNPFTTTKLDFPFLGKPLYQYVVDLVQQLPIQKLVIVVSPSMHHEYQKRHFPVPTTLVIQPQAQGMADALLKARPLVNSPILVLNATDVFEPILIESLSPLIVKNESFIVAKKVSHYFPGGYIKLNSDHHLNSVIEKPAEGKEPSDLINLVIHHFSKPEDLFQLLHHTQSESDDVYERALTQYAQKNPVKVIPYQGSWAALKYPHHVLSVSQTLLSHYLPQNPRHEGYIHATAVIEGPVYLAESAKVMPYAVIKGPSYIGPNTVIGDHVTIRESIVESGSVIGSYSEVVRSYVGLNCQLHQNYLGDSVLERDVWLGAKTLTANFRLDQTNIVLKSNPPIQTNQNKLGAFIASGVRTGVNVSFMPGVCVGQGAIIGPTTLVTGSVPAFSKIYTKQPHTIANPVVES